MWERLRSIWTIPDLRKKILFTLAMLLIYPVLAHITVPLTHTETLALTGGTMILVWLGELITENGIGNGISIIIFGGIVSGIPSLVSQGYTASSTPGGSIVSIAVFLFIGLATIIGIVYIYLGQRRVPIEDPTKRMVGRGMLVGTAQRTYIPIHVNSAGMTPPLFPHLFLLFPTLP